MVRGLGSLDLAQMLFRLSAVVAIFLIGGFMGARQLEPYRSFEHGVDTVMQIYAQLREQRPELLEPARHDGNGVTRYDANAVHSGLTLMQGLFPEGIELRLVDMSGKVINRWPLDFFAIWPNPTHLFPATEIPVNQLHYDTQGVWLMPDGSVLVNFNQLGLARLDRCGKLLWKVDRRTHHSITANADGSFWIPAKRDQREVPEEVFLQGVTRRNLLKSDGRYEDLLLLVEADGTISRELSVLKALIEGLPAGELYDIASTSRWDPTHVNDIEVVTPALAQHIEGVEAGDLLISIRQMHMLAILDRDTGALNWWNKGPGVRQHDPDINADGEIEVFNNGTESMAVNGVRGSSIVSLNPSTGALDTIYPLHGERFFTRIMGRHQALPNGNRLITESMAGRVFEVTSDGKIVWEYIARYDDTHSAVIEEAIRYEPAYFTTGDWQCPALEA